MPEDIPTVPQPRKSRRRRYRGRSCLRDTVTQFGAADPSGRYGFDVCGRLQIGRLECRITIRNSRRAPLSIVTVTIENPPVNILDVALMTDLRHVLIKARDDEAMRVIVFESGSPDFFIAHVDMALIDDPHAFDEIARDVPAGLNVFQALGELVRELPQVTIVKLAGVARGGGAEFIAACDMAFGAIGRAGLGQVEALMGIVPSGGAMQYLSTRMTRGRILEIILGGGVFSAERPPRMVGSTGRCPQPNSTISSIRSPPYRRLAGWRGAGG